MLNARALMLFLHLLPGNVGDCWSPVAFTCLLSNDVPDECRALPHVNFVDGMAMIESILEFLYSQSLHPGKPSHLNFSLAVESWSLPSSPTFLSGNVVLAPGQRSRFRESADIRYPLIAVSSSAFAESRPKVVYESPLIIEFLEGKLKRIGYVKELLARERHGCN